MEKLIEFIKYIFLGAVQGITETLPISSSGHLVIVQKIFGINDSNFQFEILLHFASLIAIFIFFRKSIIELIKNFIFFIFKKDKVQYKEDFKYAWLLVIASIPIGFIGIMFKKEIEDRLTNLLTVGIALIITATVLYIISRIPKGHKEKGDITLKDAIIIGIIQAFAVIPGISRSGSTVSASLGRKINIDNSIKFTFFLFIPAALGASALDMVDFIKNPPTGLWVPYLLAFLTAILFTYISFSIFIDILKKGKLSYFSIYCSIVGILSIVASFFIQ